MPPDWQLALLRYVSRLVPSCYVTSLHVTSHHITSHYVPCPCQVYGTAQPTIAGMVAIIKKAKQTKETEVEANKTGEAVAEKEAPVEAVKVDAPPGAASEVVETSENAGEVEVAEKIEKIIY